MSRVTVLLGVTVTERNYCSICFCEIEKGTKWYRVLQGEIIVKILAIICVRLNFVETVISYFAIQGGHLTIVLQVTRNKKFKKKYLSQTYMNKLLTPCEFCFFYFTAYRYFMLKNILQCLETDLSEH